MSAWRLFPPLKALLPGPSAGRVGGSLCTRAGVVRPSALRVRLAAMAILALCTSLSPVAGDPIAYFVSGSALLQMDLASGEATVIGTLQGHLNSLAFGPDGTLYGIGYLEGRLHLVEVDPATATTTVVVELILSEPSYYFDGMTVDACGRPWALGLLGRLGSWRKSIIAIDPATGGVEEVLSIPSLGGLAGLAASGEVLFTMRGSDLSIFDPATGEITPIGDTSTGGASFDFAADGFLWGASNPFLIPAPDPRGYTYRIDPQTAQIELVGRNEWFLDGEGAIGPPPGVCGAGSPVAIPAVSPLGLAVFALLLAAGGLIVANRRTVRPPVAG